LPLQYYRFIFTPVVLREENGFTYHPIIEVAVLFIGIFVTMIPALKILEVRGDRLGVDTPGNSLGNRGSIKFS
jgi:hypothetical protein